MKSAEVPIMAPVLVGEMPDLPAHSNPEELPREGQGDAGLKPDGEGHVSEPAPTTSEGMGAVEAPGGQAEGVQEDLVGGVKADREVDGADDDTMAFEPRSPPPFDKIREMAVQRFGGSAGSTPSSRKRPGATASPAFAGSATLGGMLGLPLAVHGGAQQPLNGDHPGAPTGLCAAVPLLDPSTGALPEPPMLHCPPSPPSVRPGAFPGPLQDDANGGSPERDGLPPPWQQCGFPLGSPTAQASIPSPPKLRVRAMCLLLFKMP